MSLCDQYAITAKSDKMRAILAAILDLAIKIKKAFRFILR